MRLPERLHRPRSPQPATPPTLREPRPAGWWIIPAALLVGGTVYVVAWWLLSSLPPLPTVAEEATARQGAIQTALAAGAGIGAVITVMLTFRRQRHQELTTLITSRQADRTAELADRVAEHNRRDAIERRITELYTKAVEQLGSDKAAVRLGGLYALERLAQGDPDHRQTIVNVICACLRMPYTPPGTTDTGSPPPGPWNTEAASTDTEGERQVRLTAQRILTEHLRDERAADQRETEAADPRLWEGMRIDLTGATLLDFDFTSCYPAGVRFDKATFIGDAEFGKLTFAEDVSFDGVTFTGKASFYKTIFTGEASFVEATFAMKTLFDKATFTEDTWFNCAAFTETARFEKATFLQGAYFEISTFNQRARFNGVTFANDAWFNRAIFGGDARFGRARFTQGASFDAVTFTENVWFDEATFTGEASFAATVVVVVRGDHCWPTGWTVDVRRNGTGMLVEEAG